jgi:hypothetical protein
VIKASPFYISILYHSSPFNYYGERMKDVVVGRERDDRLSKQKFDQFCRQYKGRVHKLLIGGVIEEYVICPGTLVKAGRHDTFNRRTLPFFGYRHSQESPLFARLPSVPAAVQQPASAW